MTMAEESNQSLQNNSGNAKGFQVEAENSNVYQAGDAINIDRSSTDKSTTAQDVTGDQNQVISKVSDQATAIGSVQGDLYQINHFAPARPPAGKPFQYQPLPSPYIDRPIIREALKTRLIDAKPSAPGTLVMSAIYGLGGIGKSVMASALVFDPDVQNAFSDGILWVTLGQAPDLLPRLSDWIRALGDHNENPTSLEAASMHLRSLLIDKQMLLVVDDVWNPEHVVPFRVGGPNCRVLVTTRQARISDAERFDMEVMSPEQSLALLLDKAQCNQPLDSEKQIARVLAKELGYLPLALELAGAQIADGLLWEELLDDLQQEMARLESLDSPDLEDATQEGSRKRLSLLASFNLSLKQLSTEQRNLFIGLGVLPEDVSFSQEMMSTLWQITPRQAGAMLRNFWSKALILRGVEQAGQRHRYRMHDLMHDVAKRLIQAPVEPDDVGGIAGWDMTVAEAHSKLLENYRQLLTQGQWYTLPDDGYIHALLTWHMQQAKQEDQIHQLFQETTAEGKNGWYEACDLLGKLSYFVTDLGRAWALAGQHFEQDATESIVLQWRYALIQTTLNTLAQNIPAELLARFVETGFWSGAQGLAYAQQVQSPSGRAQAISRLAPQLPESLLPGALEVTRNINDESSRASALSALAPQLPELWPEALKVTRNINDESYRASALSALAPQLPESLLPEALEVTRNINDESYRASALRALAPQLPESLLEAAFQDINDIKDLFHQASALSAFLNRLDMLKPESWQEKLRILGARQRQAMIQDLPKLERFMVSLGNREAFNGALQAMREVCEQWK